MDKLYFINSKVESNSVPFGSILEETREKTVIENEDTLLSCAINGIYRNDELFSHFRGSSNIGYIKIKKNDLVLSAQNLHLGNANVNLRFEHGIISPAYKAYRVIGAVPEYMAQWVKRPQANQFFLDATTEGASQCRKNIDWDTLYAQNIQLPSIEIQEKIATLLSSVDTKIKVEKIKVEKLKAIKKSMLGKMFPKEGASVPEIRFKGFTDDWEQRKLGDIAVKIGSGKTPSGGKSAYVENGIPLIRSQNVNGDKVDFADIVFIDEATDEPMANSRVYTNDVLLNITGASIGRSAVYKGLESANVNQHVCIIRPTEGYQPDFIQLNLSSDNGQKQIDASQAGGGREGLNFQEIGKMQFSFPSLNEQKYIGRYFNNFDNLITLHQRKYEKLLDVKKAFLEKLIGGDN